MKTKTKRREAQILKKRETKIIINLEKVFNNKLTDPSS